MDHPFSLPPNPKAGPKYKYRGQRRYFRNLALKAQQFQLDPQPGDWWDFWHYHPDMQGLCNQNRAGRLAELRALARVFLSIYEIRDRFASPFQTWILLDVEDAGQDAVFLHSLNANGSVFPWKPEGWTWNVAGYEGTLRPLFPGLPLRVGYERRFEQDEDGSRWRSAYILYSPGFGVPLE